MKRSHRIGAVLLLGIMLFLAACSTPASVEPATTEPGTGGAATPGMMMDETPEAMMEGTPAEMPATGMEFDRMFIDMMVPHHESAIAMAQIAQERAQNEQVRQVAENIIASQQAEIDQLRGWREEWYGSSETPPMSQMPMLTGMEDMGSGQHPMDMQAEVDALQNAAEPFDVAFILAMIPHHQQAIDAAQLALQQAEHPEVRELAQRIIDDQQREIQELLSLQAELEGTVVATPAP